tara:strand:+ start:1127 stop:1414 length:288 start_codon:yes stop_codon:yes gene_type:complete
MKAYFIGQITIINTEGYSKYISKVPNIVAEFGGKYLVRGGNSAQIEGISHGERIVVIEFPNRIQAKAWYYSDSYQKIIFHRLNNSTGDLVLVDGI